MEAEWIILGTVHMIAAAVLYLLYRMGKSQNEDIRMFRNDYELYESLPKANREYYWQASSRQILWTLGGIFISIDLPVLLGRLWSFELWIIVFCIVFGSLGVILCYIKSWRRLVRFVQEESDHADNKQ